MPAAAPPSPDWGLEDKYRVLSDSIDEGFCVVEVEFDSDGQPVDYVFAEVNAAFGRQTGLADAVGRRMRELAPAHESHWFQTYGDVARTGTAVRFEARAEALGRWFDVYAFRVGPPTRPLVAILFNDVSQRKKAQLALEESDRRKDEFIAILAHELRNPLAPLRNGLQVMKLAPDRADLVERTRQMMDRQVDLLVSLVDGLLDASRISRGRVTLTRRSADLRDIVHQAVECVESTVREHGHALAVTVPPGTVPVYIDGVRIVQALTNLLVNAAKYTPRGGRIDVDTRTDGDEAVVRVADNGSGIPPEMLERVFDLFTQVDDARNRGQAGLGIGLALVRQLATLHGGSVKAESEGRGQGTRLTLRLPLAPVAPTSTLEPGAVAALRSQRGRRRVLVADDNPDAVDSLAVILDMMGHEVRTAFDGREAVAVAKEFHPEVVLLDIGMPLMDGFEAASALRALPGGGAMVLVALTGWGDDDDRAATRAAGFDAHLVKPVTPEQLQNVLGTAA